MKILRIYNEKEEMLGGYGHITEHIDYCGKKWYRQGDYLYCPSIVKSIRYDDYDDKLYIPYRTICIMEKRP